MPKENPANAAARERMRRLRAQRRHLCAGCHKQYTLKQFCKSCVALQREARLKATGAKTQRGKHRGEKQKNAAQPKPSAQQNIVISPVFFEEAYQLTDRQKFPGGHVCNVPIANIELMQRAANELQYAITFTAPRNRDASQYAGVVTDLKHYQPQILLDHYFTLLLQRQYGVAPRTEVSA